MRETWVTIAVTTGSDVMTSPLLTEMIENRRTHLLLLSDNRLR